MTVYSEDLRVKVVEFIKKGHTYKEASEIFGVCMKSIYTWNKMDREGKRLVFEHVPRSPHRINHEQLLDYIKEHTDAYLKEISAHFSVAISTIWHALNRLGIRYKKTQSLPRSRLNKAGRIYRVSKKT